MKARGQTKYIATVCMLFCIAIPVIINDLYNHCEPMRHFEGCNINKVMV